MIDVPSSTNTNGTTSNISGATLLALMDTEPLSSGDAAWALSCAFMILTMQTGFAMLECGNVSAKNATSIMIKNCIDVTLGGLSYWCFGYGLSFGPDHPNCFCGLGHWFFSMPDSDPKWGTSYSHYFFHFSFASTATTIVSGAVAERMNLYAYMVFAFINMEIYCVPASWAWNKGTGWLAKMGFFDFAGVCIVHFGGGVSALVAAAMLGPRLGRFDKPNAYKMSSPVTALTGLFMLWWAWMSFNAGSTFGVRGNLWKVSAVAAVVTLNGGIAGGICGLILSMAMHRGKVLVNETINSVLGGLVAITGVCPLTRPSEALAIGAVGGAIAVFGQYLLNWLKIDDPVGAVPVHMLSAAWGTIAVGIFAKDITGQFHGRKGLIHGGGIQPVLVQALGMLAVAAWSGTLTMIAMKILDMTIGIRVSVDEEILGADWCHHNVQCERWNQELLADVLTRLKDETVNEHISARVLHQLTFQLVQRSNARRKSVVSRAKLGIISPKRTSSPLYPEDEPPEGKRFKHILQRKDGLMSRLRLSRLEKVVEDPTQNQRQSGSGRSQKEQLNAIIEEAATNLMPVSDSDVVQVNGPMMLPLYRTFVTQLPNDCAKASQKDDASRYSSRSTHPMDIL